jgi:predicted branched-subunit amino acid permease
MSALHFRFDRHAFFRAAQMPSRHRRHPLLRLLMGLLGLAVLLVLVAASVFVGAALLAIGLCSRLLRPRAGARAPGPGSAQGRVVEGEYTVVDGATVGSPVAEDA